MHGRVYRIVRNYELFLATHCFVLPMKRLGLNRLMLKFNIVSIVDLPNKIKPFWFFNGTVGASAGSVYEDHSLRQPLPVIKHFPVVMKG
jgi:hypothetical protein